MKGEVKCGFEGNQDVCFDQDKSDNFDWEITRVKTSLYFQMAMIYVGDGKIY